MRMFIKMGPWERHISASKVRNVPGDHAISLGKNASPARFGRMQIPCGFNRPEVNFPFHGGNRNSFAEMHQVIHYRPEGGKGYVTAGGFCHDGKPGKINGARIHVDRSSILHYQTPFNQYRYFRAIPSCFYAKRLKSNLLVNMISQKIHRRNRQNKIGFRCFCGFQIFLEPGNIHPVAQIGTIWIIDP